MQQVIQNPYKFDLNVFFYDSIKTILPLNIVSKNYFEEIIYIRILFYLLTKSISHSRFFNTFI